MVLGDTGETAVSDAFDVVVKNGGAVVKNLDLSPKPGVGAVGWKPLAPVKNGGLSPDRGLAPVG